MTVIFLWRLYGNPYWRIVLVHTCPKCQSDRVIHHGSAAGKPKKQCKQCGYQFTRTTPRGKPLAMKINAVLWYLSGMSMNRIAFLLRVSAQAVLTWIRGFAKDYCEKLEPTGRTIILQLDEMWHYLKKKRRKLWTLNLSQFVAGVNVWCASLKERVHSPNLLIFRTKIV